MRTRCALQEQEVRAQRVEQQKPPELALEQPIR
jgi:hypothetical protein